MPDWNFQKSLKVEKRIFYCLWKRECESERARERAWESGSLLTLLWHLPFDAGGKEDFEYHFLEPCIWVWKPKFEKEKQSKTFFLLFIFNFLFMLVAIFQFSVLSFHFLSLEGGRREKTFGTEFKQHLKCSECAISLSHNSQMSERERECVCAKEVVWVSERERCEMSAWVCIWKKESVCLIEMRCVFVWRRDEMCARVWEKVCVWERERERER